MTTHFLSDLLKENGFPVETIIPETHDYCAEIHIRSDIVVEILNESEFVVAQHLPALGFVSGVRHYTPTSLITELKEIFALESGVLPSGLPAFDEAILLDYLSNMTQEQPSLSAIEWARRHYIETRGNYEELASAIVSLDMIGGPN